MALSTLLLVATVVLWARSYLIRDTFWWVGDGGIGHHGQSILGRAHLVTNLDGGSAGPPGHVADRLSPDAIWNGGMSGYPVHPKWRFGFIVQEYQRYHMDWRASQPGFWTNHRLIVVPYWAPALLFAILPMIGLLRRVLGVNRFGRGMCRTCGYDLRASGERCPECGTSVSGR